MEWMGAADRQVLVARLPRGMWDCETIWECQCFSGKKGEHTRQCVRSLADSEHRRFGENQKSRKRDHTQDRKRKWGCSCLPFSKAGDVYLYVDDAEIEQVHYEVVVSKAK